MDNVFVTLTGVNHYYGMKPFQPDRIVKLVKEPGNDHDSEAIAVELPYIDKVGYVANSAGTVAKGTRSAGRIYDLFEEEAFAQVLFVTHASIICLLILQDADDPDPDSEPDETEEKVYCVDLAVSDLSHNA